MLTKCAESFVDIEYIFKFLQVCLDEQVPLQSHSCIVHAHLRARGRTRACMHTYTRVCTYDGVVLALVLALVLPLVLTLRRSY